MKTPKLRVSVPSRAFHASARRLQPEIDPKIVSNPGAAKPKPESQQEPLYDESRQSDSWQYDPSKDPMLKLSPEELKAMKKDIDQGAQRAFSIGCVVGGGRGTPIR